MIRTNLREGNVFSRICLSAGGRAGGKHLFTQDALDLTIPRDLPPDVRLHSTGTPKPCAPSKKFKLVTARQRSWGEVMFSHMFVCPGGWVSLVPCPFWEVGILVLRPFGLLTPQTYPTPPVLTSSGGHRSGQLVSYWNAFLLKEIFFAVLALRECMSEIGKVSSIFSECIIFIMFRYVCTVVYISNAYQRAYLQSCSLLCDSRVDLRSQGQVKVKFAQVLP